MGEFSKDIEQIRKVMSPDRPPLMTRTRRILSVIPAFLLGLLVAVIYSLGVLLISEINQPWFNSAPRNPPGPEVLLYLMNFVIISVFVMKADGKVSASAVTTVILISMGIVFLGILNACS